LRQHRFALRAHRVSFISVRMSPVHTSLGKAFPLFLEQVVFLGRLKGEIYEYIF
jgi:hypothetical protein